MDESAKPDAYRAVRAALAALLADEDDFIAANQLAAFSALGRRELEAICADLARRFPAG